MFYSIVRVVTLTALFGMLGAGIYSRVTLKTCVETHALYIDTNALGMWTCTDVEVTEKGK